MADMATLIARLGIDEVDWVGTSLGGLLGMMLAAQPNSPIRRLVLNDIGAFRRQGGAGSGFVVMSAPTHCSPTSTRWRATCAEIHAPFGPLTDAQWRHIASHSARPEPAGGGPRLHYDPALAVAFKEGFDADVELWPLWDAISCPVLILRGGESDILSHETAATMLTRGPEAELIDFPGIGHAPMLMDAAQIAAVHDFLMGR